MASLTERRGFCSDDVEGLPRDGAHDGVVDREISTALGVELKRAREAAGLPQVHLVARMPSALHAKTLASYEQGARQCTVVRLCEIARALGVSPTDLLAKALLHAEIDLQTVSVYVDVRALSQDRCPELKPLRRWASARLSVYPETTLVRSAGNVVQEMAVMFGSTVTELVGQLARFASPVSAGTGAER